MNGMVADSADLTHDHPAQRLSRLLPECLVISGCIAVIWGAIAFTLWESRAAAVETARQQTATLARAYAESTERMSTVLNRQLLSLRASVLEKGAAFDLMEWERTRSSSDPLTLHVSVVDRDGLIIHSTMDMKERRIVIADREHFRVHLDPERDLPYISRPLLDKATNLWAVQYSRKILDAGGNFAGVGVVSVSSDDLSGFYGRAKVEGGFVGLVGTDGFVRGFGPFQPGVLDRDLKQSAALRPLLWEQEGTLLVEAPWDGARHIVSFRHLDQFPLIVMVGYDEDAVFHQYHALRERALGIGVTATLIILILGAVWIQQRLRSARSRRALLLTLDTMSQGIVLIDADGRVPVINRRAVALMDLPSHLLDPRREARKAEAEALGLPFHATSAGSEASHKDGRIIETLTQPLRGGGLVRTYTDVTEQRIAEARIRHMAHHDPLTGLANRILLNERIAESARGQPDAPLTLLWLDLDGFKSLNDTLGHDGGDRLLRETGRRLSALARKDVLVARVGGDEFAMLCTGEDGPAAMRQRAAGILKALDEAIDIDGVHFRLSASIGYACHPHDSLTPDLLLRHAVTAMYQARELGRGQAIRFDKNMDNALRERGEIERDLRRALRGKELEVWFQPRFETNPLRISGFEALARWRHPVRGFISPAQFIPVAEQCGLIADLGMHVLEDACAFAASLPEGRIAVNLSPVQFLSDNLPDLIIEVLTRHGLTPDRLELEVTEGVLIGDEAQALKTLEGLHARDLHLALDDFGTGYASLSYLRRFPFDRIKIDQSFVRAQEHDATTRAIIESVLTMARRLHLEVTAEGVETERQLDLLLEQGCPEIQGYFLGRPMPAAEARAFHAARRVPEVAHGLLDLTAA